MASISNPLRDAALALAWSLWAELGVSGWTRRHADWAIDPEPLILFTAALGDADPRLRDESTDWCLRYHRYVSVARLRNVLRDTWSEVSAEFGEYAATVNAHAPARWPAATVPRVYQRSGRSSLGDFRSPALVLLRLRAVFGVTARADLIGVLVADPERSLASADLAQAVGFSKRNVEKEIEPLRLAGLVESITVRNERRHRLLRRAETGIFLAPLPSYFPRWSPLLHVVWQVLQFTSRAEHLEPVVRAVEVKRGLRSLADDLRQAGLAPPRSTSEGAFWESCTAWATELFERLASGRPPAADGSRGWRALSWSDPAASPPGPQARSDEPAHR